jgi:hypothetical protein
MLFKLLGWFRQSGLNIFADVRAGFVVLSQAGTNLVLTVVKKKLVLTKPWIVDIRGGLP